MLSPDQSVTFGNHIRNNTDPTVVQDLADGNNNGLAEWYNQAATPSYWIFRSQVTAEELSNSIDLQDIADITSADSDRVLKMFQLRALNGNYFDGTDPRTRSAWDDVFSAASGDNSQQAIASLWRRLCTEVELIFALSSGAGTNGDPDVTGFEGSVSSDDVNEALLLTA